TIEVNQIDFAKTPLPQYTGLYAVVLDNVLSQSECDELIHMAEQSAGGHDPAEPMENNGWKPAMVNAGRDHEFLALNYRNSDRIIWDNEEIMQRLWQRILQVKEMKDYFSVMQGREYIPVAGDDLVMMDERWVISPKGPNERMRFLKYGAGQFFRPHCDGTYQTPDGAQRSFFTLHLYLNDSAQALGIKEPMFGFLKGKNANGEEEMLRGGATTFHSLDKKKRLDVDPKAGRVLIFQQKRLYHSGDDVTAGIKYTLRSDLMYGLEGGEEDGNEDPLVFR
ncbi:hypothetical protein LAWI1_G008578, partial [Lachnellula willkommii]